jgi:hypothetical protein
MAGVLRRGPAAEMGASHLELFVEEASMGAALHTLVPKIRSDLTFRVYEHQGCQDLLAKLPSRLRGYRGWIPGDCRIIVLIDRDRKDCKALKQKILDMAMSAGLSQPGAPALRCSCGSSLRSSSPGILATFLRSARHFRACRPILGRKPSSAIQM